MREKHGQTWLLVAACALLIYPLMGAKGCPPPAPQPTPTPTPEPDPSPICSPGDICGCWHRPPGEAWQQLPECPPPPVDPPPVDPPPVTPTGCWSDEALMVVVPGTPTMQPVVVAAMKAVEGFGGTPKAMLERLAAQLVAAGSCAFAGQEAVFVLDAEALWEEYHAVYFADGIVGQWIPGGKYMATHKGDGAAPPVTTLCGEPAPPPLVDFNLHCGSRWCDATPIVYGCEFCSAIGLGEMPGQPGVKRCNCPAGNEDSPLKRQACERLVIGGAALWRSSSSVEVNGENHLQARCSSPCSWIEVCRADGTKCTRSE